MIHLLLMLLLAITPAQAKTKTKSAQIKSPHTRISEAFQDWRLYKPPPARAAKPFDDPDWTPPTARQTLRVFTPFYVYDHYWYYTDGHGKDGKLWIVKECEIDMKQDPVETSCKATFAKI